MKNCVGLLIALFLVPTVAHAQDELLKNYMPSDFEKFIKKDLKKGFDKKVEKDNVIYAIKDSFRVYFHARNKYLILDITESAKNTFQNEVTLDKLNAWNRDAIYSRAYLETGGTFRFEGTLSFSAGVTPNQVRSFYDHLHAELVQFGKFFGGLKKKNGGGKEVPPPRGKPLAQGEQTASFPFGAEATKVQTAWRVRYVIDPNHGLRIVGAWFKRPGETPVWLKVVEDLTVCQLYVPYEDNSKRYFDMDLRFLPRHAPWKLNQLPLGEKNLVGPHGKILGDQYTVREDLDAGLLWLYNDGGFQMEGQKLGEPRVGKTFAVRRQEMLLWGVYQGSNYFYIQQYAFQNDGTIVCRVGSTGQNLHQHAGGHMHNTLWRVQLDLGGRGPEETSGTLADNRAFVVRHEELEKGKGKASTTPTLIQSEGPHKWRAEEFTSIRIENSAVKNRLGRPVSYDFVPVRHGTARHYAPERLGDPRNAAMDRVPNDDFTHHDFWVINNNPAYVDYRNLPVYVKDRKQLGGNPVIWHISSNLHTPRDEDLINPKEKRAVGCATVLFSGFELRPRSVFRDTPFLAPGKITTGFTLRFALSPCSEC